MNTKIQDIIASFETNITELFDEEHINLMASGLGYLPILTYIETREIDNGVATDSNGDPILDENNNEIRNISIEEVTVEEPNPQSAVTYLANYFFKSLQAQAEEGILIGAQKQAQETLEAQKKALL